MKRTIYSFFTLTLFCIGSYILFTSSSNGRAFAANAGNTGAPGETTTCRSCHGTGFGTTVSIEFRDGRGALASQYVPGATYTLTVRVNNSSGNPSRFGFQMVALRSGNVPYNAWSNASSNTRIVPLNNGRTYAEQAGKSATNSFTVNWTAPPTGSGNVTFYAGGAAVNNNGGTSGDGGNTTTLTVMQDVTTSIDESDLNLQLSVFPNPTTDFVWVKNTAPQSINGNLRILDISGKLLRNDLVNIPTSSDYKVDVSDLPQGLYLMQLDDNEGKTATHRLMIQ